MDLKPRIEAKQPATTTSQERQKDIREETAEQLQRHNREELMKKEAELRKLMGDMEQRRQKEDQERQTKQQQEAAAISAREDFPPEVKQFILGKIATEGQQLSSLAQRAHETQKARLASELHAVSMKLHPANNQFENDAHAAGQEVKATSKELMFDFKAETAAKQEDVGAEVPPMRLAI